MHSFDASTMNFGEVVQHISPLNKRLAFFDTTLRANLRLKKVLEKNRLFFSKEPIETPKDRCALSFITYIS